MNEGIMGLIKKIDERTADSVEFVGMIGEQEYVFYSTHTNQIYLCDEFDDNIEPKTLTHEEFENLCAMKDKISKLSTNHR